jgi:uncharacterized membrane protein
MDRPIPFYVLVIPRERAKDIGDVESRVWTQQEIGALNVGYVRLELVPRGQGKLLVRAPQLFHSIKADGIVGMNVDVVNEGTRRLDNVEVKIDPPLNWTKSTEPALVQTLGIDEEKRIHLEFAPPRDIAAGRYEIRLRTSALSDNQPVNAEDKTVTVEIVPDTNVVGTTLLVLVILGLVSGLVVFGVRLSRK